MNHLIVIQILTACTYNTKEILKMNELRCQLNCCRYIVNEPTCRTYTPPKETQSRLKKAGMCVYDLKYGSVLLVQSRGNLWGFPKGSLLPQEDVKDGAIREVFEETGLTISKEQLNDFLIIKGRSIYYMIDTEKTDVCVQNSVEDNDANGIGWFKMECLSNLIETKQISLNSHSKILIAKIERKFVKG